MARNLGLLLLLVGLVSPALAADVVLHAEALRPGRILMLRHAKAPGNGDPANFRLDDCTTQRNLDAAGREQARRLGRRLAKAGATGARVFSSQWCRCLETARLLELGPVTPMPALNSFYPAPESREPRIAALRAFLAEQPSNGSPVVLVTHQFTIAELTGGATPSGGGAVFELNGTGSPRLVGQLSPD